MKAIKYAIVIAAVLVAVCVAQNDDADWKNYKQSHKKNYADAKEEAKRKALFAATNKKIKEHNANAKAGFTMGHNHLSDATEEEKASLLGATSSSHQPDQVTESGVVVPSSRQSLASVDLRTSACMSAIRNQANCGSCWAFSTLASVEYSYCKKYGVLYNFSEQQLVDCVYANGCNGGWMTTAMFYLKNTANASTTEASYSYTSGSTAVGGTCKFSSVPASSKVGMRAMGIYQVASLDHVSMANALASYGTLAVALDVADNGFYYYTSGVYKSTVCSQSSVNHAVNIVGYGTTSTGQKYWIMRNSWGTGWGSAGYMLIARGVNMCNIERYAFFNVFP